MHKKVSDNFFTSTFFYKFMLVNIFDNKEIQRKLVITVRPVCPDTKTFSRSQRGKNPDLNRKPNVRFLKQK